MSHYWTLLRLQPQQQPRYIFFAAEHFPHIELYYPQHQTLSRPAGRRRPIRVTRPTFPGYIFAKPDFDHGEHNSLIHGIPFRVFFVRFSGTIETIPEPVITELRRLESINQLVPIIERPRPYRPGQRVQVNLPTASIIGTIKKIMQIRAIIDTSFCNITVPIHQIAPLAAS